MENIEQKINESSKLLNNGKYQESINMLEKILIEYEKSIDIKQKAIIYFHLSTNYFYLKNYEKALDFLDDYISINDKDSGAYNNKGYIYELMKENNKAIECYQKATQLIPDTEDFLRKKANLLFRMYKLGESVVGKAALELYESLIKKNSEDYSLYYERSLLFNSMEKYDEQVKDLKKALENKPDFEQGAFDLGNYYMNKGENAIALKYFDQAIHNNNKYVEAYINKAIVHFRQNDVTNALSSIEIATKIGPEKRESWLNKGIIAEQMGKYSDAIECYQKIIEMNNDDSVAYYLMGLSQYKNKDIKSALDSYTNALKINKNFVDALINRGNILLDEERYTEALSDYHRVLKINDNNSKAWFNTGVVNFKLENFNEALECFKKAFISDPKDFYALTYQGHTLISLNKYEDAIEVYSQSMKFKKDIPLILDNIIYCQMKLGWYIDAIKSFQEVLANDPTNERSILNLIELYIITYDNNKALDFIKKIKIDNTNNKIIYKFLDVVLSCIEYNIQIDQNEVISELKFLSNNNPNIFNWSFEELKNWVLDPFNKKVEQQKKDYIINLIKLIENWKNCSK